MSRTDIHVPAWVKQRDPLWRDAYIQSHDHWESEYAQDPVTGLWTVCVYRRSMPCDLDAYLAGAPRTRCCLWPVGSGMCGCRMCTGYYSRRADRRAERVAWRSRRALIMALVDRSDVDVPEPHGSAW